MILKRRQLQWSDLRRPNKPRPERRAAAARLQLRRANLLSGALQRLSCATQARVRTLFRQRHGTTTRPGLLEQQQH